MYKNTFYYILSYQFGGQSCIDSQHCLLRCYVSGPFWDTMLVLFLIISGPIQNAMLMVTLGMSCQWSFWNAMLVVLLECNVGGPFWNVMFSGQFRNAILVLFQWSLVECHVNVCMYVCLFFSLHVWRVTHRTHKLELLVPLGMLCQCCFSGLLWNSMLVIPLGILCQWSLLGCYVSGLLWDAMLVVPFGMLC